MSGLPPPPAASDGRVYVSPNEFVTVHDWMIAEVPEEVADRTRKAAFAYVLTPWWHFRERRSRRRELDAASRDYWAAKIKSLQRRFA